MMPGSDISRLSIAGNPKSDMASQMARDAANRKITQLINTGRLDRNDTDMVRLQWKSLYTAEYYRLYAQLVAGDPQRVIIIQQENPSARKFYKRHSVAGFSKTNLFVQVHSGGRVTVSKFNYSIDMSLDTKEAFLEQWPGPLDRHDDQLKGKTTDYVDTLLEYDLQRQIRYCSNDHQRKTILKLLSVLLRQNGSIDASCITELLLNPEQTETTKDDPSKISLKPLRKYLLRGKRSEAIKYAKTRKLWDHVLCLYFLDRYQPDTGYQHVKDSLRLKDDSGVQLIDECINSLDDDVLKIVYRSLFNRFLQSDPGSLDIVKHPNIDNDAYQFAILSANDCEMEYDQKNEIFKLVNAIKKASTYPGVSSNHLISLGFTTLDTCDPIEDMSYRSHLSFRQNDTCAARTLIISNIDLLILNEVWEYCLNLVHKINDPQNYHYIIDLVPYKLVFAARLLDFGLYGMFAYYLTSIKNALHKAKQQSSSERDQFYDWDAIELSVQHLTGIWEVFQMSPYLLKSQDFPSPPSVADPTSNLTSPTEPITLNPTPPLINSFQPQAPSSSSFQHQQPDHQDSSYLDHSALSNQGQSVFITNPNFTAPQMPRGSYMGLGIPNNFMQHQPPIAEEVTDFNPDPDPLEQQQQQQGQDYSDQQPQQPLHYSQPRHPMHNQQQYIDHSNETSRRTSLDVPPYSPPSYVQPNMSMPDRNVKSMASSSPVNNNRDSNQFNPVMADSFNAFSPINDYEDLSRRDNDQYRTQPQTAPPQERAPPPSANGGANIIPSSAGSRPAAGSSSLAEVDNGSVKSLNKNAESRTNDSQQAGFIANLAGSVRSLLPKSNSKQMILPDDSKPSIVFDQERNAWVDTVKPDGEDALNLNEPPPVLAAKPPSSYSFAPKSAKTRYPRTQY